MRMLFYSFKSEAHKLDFNIENITINFYARLNLYKLNLNFQVYIIHFYAEIFL